MDMMTRKQLINVVLEDKTEHNLLKSVSAGANGISVHITITQFQNKIITTKDYITGYKICIKSVCAGVLICVSFPLKSY